jgi:dolichol-phosphate mannosyltransferase
VLARRLDDALADVEWEAIFVDDDSADGTIDAIRALSRSNSRIRGIRRIARRGLSGAAPEGILSTSAQYVAVMDADLQHDETRLMEMLACLKKGKADVVVASRYVENGNAKIGFSRSRQLASRLAIQLAQFVFKKPLSDPISGFFMLGRNVVDETAPRACPNATLNPHR